jgi:hypothetical protein
MLVVGHAMVLGAFLTGLMLAGLIGFGAALTIGIFGTVGIIARRGFLGRFDPESRAFKRTITSLEIASSAFIFGLGVTLFVGNLNTLIGS